LSGKIPTAKTWLPVALVIVLALALYLPFQSVSLDDLDSYNFARALVKFDPAQSTPHAPGYVLYVGLGRIVYALVGDARMALTLLSAVCAALACGLLFAMARALFNASVAAISVALVLPTPLLWLNADKALSDAPGLLAQAVCMAFIVLAIRRKAPLWAAGACLGLAAGFRPQGVLGLAAALLLAAVWLRAKPKAWLAAGAAILVSAAAWLLPLLAAFGWNLHGLYVYLTGATSFVTSQESLFATALSGESIAARWSDVWFWSSQAVYGPLVDWLRAALFAGTLVLAGFACIKHRKDVGVWLCVAWLAPQVVLQLLFLNPTLTRYLLALLFPTAILVAAGLDTLFRRRFISAAIVLAFVAIVGVAAFPVALGLHTVPAPPEQLASYIAERFPEDGTLVIARQSYSALAYRLPGWDVRFADYFGDAALLDEIARTQPSYVVIADPETLRPGEEYVEVETRTFSRDAQIHAKHAHVDVNVYGRAESLSPRDFALPESGAILVGTPQDAKYLLGGWHRREEVGGIPARWMGAESVAFLRVLLPSSAKTLTLKTLSFPPDQVVEVLCNGEAVGSASVPQGWVEVSVAMPPSCIQSDALTHIGLRPASLASPSADGRSTDTRLLGIAVAEIRFGP
jgi:hypothetical protein